jgi:hypothetical protein
MKAYDNAANNFTQRRKDKEKPKALSSNQSFASFGLSVLCASA